MDLETLRHSCAHVLAQAVKEIYPETKLGIGPPIEDGFYYDFDKREPFTEEDLSRIEQKMRQIIGRDIPFIRKDLDRSEAKKLFAGLNEDYKLELIDELPEEKVTIYNTGEDFIDLCRGPHLRRTGQIKAFKLLSTAGAYWRGKQTNPMLQRIYGTCFNTQRQLDEYLERLEEARRRDHRRLAKLLGLFSIEEEIGPGLILWHPKGAIVRNIIEEFWRNEHLKAGYKLLYTPHIAKMELWKTSGHLEFYKDYMYSPMEVEGQKYILKPMNCPAHILIYKSKLRSYRDLPIRWAELGTVYRYERSGVLHGLMRVRGFTQDDAHIFCRPDQLEEEIVNVLNLGRSILAVFGFKEYQIFLSTMPEKHVGSIQEWEGAQRSLKSALAKTGLEFEIDPGEGVFYGPKIDIKIRDSLGRAWQCSTIQVDFNLPERFGISFVAEDGTKQNPIMIHRALFGSLERFFGVLLEHYAGALPLWLAPVQVSVLPVTSKNLAYSKGIKDQLEAHSIRTAIDERDERLPRKIRDAEVQKVPYMIVIGKKEESERLVTLRARGSGDQGSLNREEFIKRITREIEERG